jgi:hypothetical protein
MPSPSHLRRLAEQATRRADELERDAALEVRLLREQAVELRRLADLAEKSGLAIGHDRSIIHHEMESSAYAQKAAKPGRPSESNHPFPVALGKLKPAVTLRQWAETHDLSRSKVASWLLTGDGGRRIPRKYADEIKKDFGVPLSAWPNGIRED